MTQQTYNLKNVSGLISKLHINRYNPYNKSSLRFLIIIKSAKGSQGQIV